MSESTATRVSKHLPCDSKQHACLSVCDHSYRCQSGQRNLTKSPHHRHTWTVQWHSPGGANVHPHPTPASIGPTESILQTASRLIQPFLHSSKQGVPILYNGLPLSLSKLSLHIGPSNTWFSKPIRIHNPNGISTGLAIFCRAHDPDRQTDHSLFM